MISAHQFREISHLTKKKAPLKESLQSILELALKWTNSRNALLALFNEDEGALRLTHGIGSDWDAEEEGAILRVDIREGEGLVATAAAQRNSIVSGDVRADPRYRQLYPTSKSEMAVPIIDRSGRLQGVLNVESDRIQNYSEDELKILEGISEQLSIVLSRDERIRREAALIEVGSVLEMSNSVEELLSRVLSVTDEVLNFHSCSIFLFDKMRELFVLRGSTGSLADKVDEIGYEPNEGCTGWVCANGTALLLHEPQSDPRWVGRFIEFPTDSIASYLCVPIISRGKSVGALRVVRQKSENLFLDNSFTEDDLRLLTAIADQLAAGIENLRQFEKALRVERMAAWGEMSAKSSHMIGNRVFALRGDINELGHLIKETPLNQTALDSISHSIRNNVHRIEEILQDFRDYLTAAKVNVALLDLNHLVEEAVTEVFPRRSEAVLKFELDENLPMIEADGARMRRALGEVVENSISIRGDGVFIVKTALASAELLKDAKLPPNQDFVQITMEDEGPGVPDAEKERIFEPFFSTRVKGMGLGLSIVRGIAQAHGGTVIEVGEQGQGAKFVFLLPVPKRP